MSRSKFLAAVQLLRLPNLFTAVADPLAGWLLTGHQGALLLPVATSACLYTAGMVFNDYFDYQLDCRERPERPLPRGEISRNMASFLGVLLCFAGALCGMTAGGVTPYITQLLIPLILFYNLTAKRFTWLGPVTLGCCRALNFALGMGGFTPAAPLVILGVYVACLTLIARREAVRPALRRVVKNLLLGIIVLDAGFVLAITGDWTGAALVLSLLVPATVLGRIIPMT